DAHGGEEVVGGIGVVVDSTVEHGSGVLADARGDQGAATWVLLDEVGHVVDDTSHGNQGAAVPGLLLVRVPVDDGQLLQRDTPVEGLTLLIELLLELLQTALLNLVLLE